ncbi:MAG TPA: ABC transporter ATP-binding protein [Candidatus Nitrosotalea sp.]|nr:ABC transporter ATP-binding protein [Candidatus Nitrosotalea sp.]
MSRPAADRNVFARIVAFARPYWLLVAGTFGLSLAAVPLTLLTPLPLKIAVDSVIGSKPLPAFLALPLRFAGENSYAILAADAALLIFITFLLYAQGMAVWLASTYLGERLVLDFRAALFRHAQRLSLAYHDRTGTTDSVFRIQYDAECLQHVLVDGLIPLVSALLTAVSVIAVTALLNAQLALVSLVVCPILYLLTGRFGRRLRGRWYEVKDIESSAMSVVQEALSAGRVVKAFGQEEYEQRRFLHRASRRLRGQLDIAWLQSKFDLAIGVTVAAGTAAVLLLGVMQVKAGNLTTGALLMVLAYQAQVYLPLKTVSKKIADLQSGLASAGRAFSLLDELPEVSERPRARRLERARGDFVFDDVSFAYEAGNEVLRGVRLVIRAGSRVGIQGRTGAGKTTFVSLLTRFYDPIRGAILLDGVDLREYKLADLRAQFAIVLQETMLFSTTIRENIAYGRPDATDEEIREAARRANAHEFIEALPNGYLTEVGERGMRLSGGERQRVSIARAFLKDAPILLLDEPTSALDLTTEAAIVDAMERLMVNRTVFLIAHRPSTLARCDLFLTVEEGSIRDRERERSLFTA